MSKKKAFQLRISEELMDALEKWASDEFRSVNGQIEWIISQTLKDSGRWKEKNTSQNDIPDNFQKSLD
jgi:hypothetical protein